ncbi:hemerythrin domain-containing protein [Piscinibacter koreensis]|uniref:Hemerythrin domain-containing protein n=1 Tax=Piscinibacter koreensis TaxID=2742824 RepID=A0A7Y6NLW7_9BURK|nr:hemerythrin domain-containing protein [Schlegelella koreensis]NUZ05516.1 hemerythrin domain-containing protein [Schlegelella koreensis]
MSTSTLDAVRPATTVNTAAAPRFDMYAWIHKALRAFMSDTLVRIGRLDVSDPADRDAGLAQLNELLDFCCDHIRHENDFIHTAIEARRPAGASRVAGEHVDHLDSIDALRSEAAGLAAAPAASAPALALRLYRHLALFVAENFEHMHVEETQHNAMLWEQYSDAELVALHDRLVASIPPAGQLLVARWMLPMLPPVDRALLVGDMKAGMPPEALLGVLTMVRPHLDAAGWRKLALAAGVAPGA